jgi:hypothetical protein
MYCYGGVEGSKGGDGGEEEDCGAAGSLPHAVAPVGAPSAAAAGLYGEVLCRWRQRYKHALVLEHPPQSNGQLQYLIEGTSPRGLTCHYADRTEYI